MHQLQPLRALVTVRRDGSYIVFDLADFQLQRDGIIPMVRMRVGIHAENVFIRRVAELGQGKGNALVFTAVVENKPAVGVCGCLKSAVELRNQRRPRLGQ